MRDSVLHVQLRPAVPDDATRVAEVHVRAWQAGFRGLLPADSLAGLDPSERARRYTFGITDGSKPQTLVAVHDGAIRGFATTGLHEGEALLHALLGDSSHDSSHLVVARGASCRGTDGRLRRGGELRVLLRGHLAHPGSAAVVARRAPAINPSGRRGAM